MYRIEVCFVIAYIAMYILNCFQVKAIFIFHKWNISLLYFLTKKLHRQFYIKYNKFEIAQSKLFLDSSVIIFEQKMLNEVFLWLSVAKETKQMKLEKNRDQLVMHLDLLWVKYNLIVAVIMMKSKDEVGNVPGPPYLNLLWHSLETAWWQTSNNSTIW